MDALLYILLVFFVSGLALYVAWHIRKNREIEFSDVLAVAAIILTLILALPQIVENEEKPEEPTSSPSGGQPTIEATIGEPISIRPTLSPVVEPTFTLSPVTPTQTIDAKAATQTALESSDLDGDGLTYVQEITLGSSPSDSDTDGDGLLDGEDQKPTIRNYRIAFESLNNGNPAISIVNYDGTNLESYLTIEGASDPEWSPDGSKLAYHVHNPSIDSSDLKVGIVYGVFLSGEEQIAGDVFQGCTAWSGDGSLLAFTRLSEDFNAEYYVIEEDGENEQRINLDSEQHTSIMELCPIWLLANSNLLAPVFSRNDERTIKWYEADLTTGALTLLPPPLSDADSICSSINNMQLTFIVDGEIYKMDPHNVSTTADYVSKIGPSFLGGIAHSWKSDCSEVAYYSIYDRTVYVVDIETGNSVVALTSDYVYGEEGYVDSLTWAPDGRYIAAISGQTLLRFTPDGSEVVILAENASAVNPIRFMGAVSWSP